LRRIRKLFRRVSLAEEELAVAVGVPIGKSGRRRRPRSAMIRIISARCGRVILASFWTANCTSIARLVVTISPTDLASILSGMRNEIHFIFPNLITT
jgi:hypothetical protein